MVKTRKQDADGNPIGKANFNPLLDICLYEVEFPDGDLQEYAANVIAESVYSQVDDEGHHHLLLESLVDHAKDDMEVPRWTIATLSQTVTKDASSQPKSGDYASNGRMVPHPEKHSKIQKSRTRWR